MITAFSSRFVPSVGRTQSLSSKLENVARASPCRTHVKRVSRTATMSVKATAAEDSAQIVEGQVSKELMESMKSKIAEALQTENVSVKDLSGDGRHVSIDVISSLFEGQNSMQRQRMVYKSIWLELQEAVHAVDAMSTKTPAEAGL